MRKGGIIKAGICAHLDVSTVRVSFNAFDCSPSPFCSLISHISLHTHKINDDLI